MSNSRIVDADCHILEPPDIWKNHLGSKWQEKAPKLVKDYQGGDAWLTAVGGQPDPIGLVSTPGMPFDKFRWYGVTYEEARAGCYNGAERLKDMDIDGVSAEVLFPPQRTMSHFLGDDDEDFVLAGVEAYNSFLFDEFCAPDPKRLIGMAQIPSIGIDSAIDGLRKAKARGAKGVRHLQLAGRQRRALGRRRPVLGGGGRRRSAGHDPHQHHQSQAAHGRPQGNGRGGSQLYDMSSEATRAKAIGGMSHVFSMATGCMTDLIFTGVFERFPELQVCWIETGVGWIPHFLECLDDRWWRNRVWGDLPLTEPPSFYWYRNNAASFIIDHTGVELRNRVGVDNMMWSSDYPHHGNDWPYSRRTIEDMMGSVAEDERARISGGNATRIWRLDD